MPAIDFKVAAGGFSPDQVVEPGHYDWVTFEGKTPPGPDLFLAQGEVAGRIANTPWYENDGADYYHWALGGLSLSQTGTATRLTTRRDFESGLRRVATNVGSTPTL